MRRTQALALVLALSACAVPAGRTVAECDASWREVESVIVQQSPSEAEPLPIECMRRVDQSRVRIGFTMPPGPTCYVLSAVDVVEAAESVSIALSMTAVADPAAGACPEEATRSATEIDLQAPVDDRILLDGSS